MLPPNEDKKMLIESMKKLTNHISSSPTHQKQIIDSLESTNLLKIINHLSDENQYLRRISGLFLAQLFYNNQYAKLKAICLLQIYPLEGRICLNQIPPQIQKYPSTFKKCIELMKSPIKQAEDQRFCWTINLDRKVLQIQFLEYKKYSSFTFLDPNRNIFGFTFLNKSKKQQLKIEKSIDSSSKQKSSTFYKNYLDFRNKKSQSPNSYKDYYEKRDFNKPNTSKNHKNEYMANNYKNHTIQNIYNHNKNAKDYERIGTPKKENYNYQINLNSSHQSIELGSSGFRSPIGSAHREALLSHRQTQTDKKHAASYRYKISDSEVFSSTSQKQKYPQTAKNSSINSTQHDKFYKRVKQILKR